jgi:hypothetical protein
MDEGQFRRGLAGGTGVLAIAGYFWFGVSFALTTYKWGWLTWALSTTAQVAITLSILWAAVRLRRRSRFAPGDVRQADERQRAATRRIVRAFGWIVLAQTILVASAVWWCIRAGAHDMVWPSIGLIVSAHFAPLGRIFHVRVYYATAFAGIVISLSAFTGLTDVHHLAFGFAMAAVMWLSGWYIIRNASRITARAVSETWAV